MFQMENKTEHIMFINNNPKCIKSPCILCYISVCFFLVMATISLQICNVNTALIELLISKDKNIILKNKNEIKIGDGFHMWFDKSLISWISNTLFIKSQLSISRK